MTDQKTKYPCTCTEKLNPDCKQAVRWGYKFYCSTHNECTGHQHGPFLNPSTGCCSHEEYFPCEIRTGVFHTYNCFVCSADAKKCHASSCTVCIGEETCHTGECIQCPSSPNACHQDGYDLADVEDAHCETCIAAEEALDAYAEQSYEEAFEAAGGDLEAMDDWVRPTSIPNSI